MAMFNSKKFSIFSRISQYAVLTFLLVGISSFGGSITHAATTVKIGIPASFEAKVIPGATYSWIFPGGITKTGKDVTFTFDEPGKTDITLKVDKNGETETVTKEVFVQNAEKPTAIAKVTVDGESFYGGTVPYTRGQSITFTSESITTGGSANDLVETWSIDGQSENPVTIPHLLTAAKLYPVKLIVAKKGVPNIRDEVLFQIDVDNLAPEIQNITVQEDEKNGGQQVKISVQANDPDGTIAQYRFEILEFNKVQLAQVTKQPNATFNLKQFPGEHRYTVRVSVQDDDQKETSKTHESPIEITSDIQNTAPTVSLKVTPGNAGTTKTTFTFAAETSDADGDALRYKWTLPNGKVKTSQSFEYEFKETGTKKITLEVTDGIETVTQKTEVEVRLETKNKNQPPSVSIKGVWPNLVGDTETVFKFYANISDEDNDDIKSIWEFEKGKTSNVLNSAYRFEKPGEYTVKLVGSDGEFEVTDEIVITVLKFGEAIPETDSERVLKKEIEGDEELMVKIASTSNIIKNCDPFDPRLRTVLETERQSRQEILDTNTSLSEKNRASLERAIALITEKIELIESDPFALRGEFNDGKIAMLMAEREIEIKSFRAETRNKERRDQIQAKITTLSKAIRRRELGVSKEVLIEDILVSAHKNRKSLLEKTTDKIKAFRLTTEIASIEEAIEQLQNSPFLARTEKTKACLISVKEKTTDPTKIQQLEKQIERINQDPEPEESRFIFADIIATTDTKLFFYGQAPKDLQQALFFEWDLGKDIRVPGQNISLRYKKLGLYRVILRVSDGDKEVSDVVTIKIVEKEK